MDPGMITSAFATTVMVHPELSRLVSGTAPPHFDNRDAIRAYTKFWLDVLTPHPQIRTWDPGTVGEAAHLSASTEAGE